jgi:TATA-binding protein-associated factor
VNLEQLLDPTKLDHYKLPPTINATLRSYQQDGVNWMKFLNIYQLHGILCDDMGLGKTLQSICIIAGDHHERLLCGDAHLPSLIVCPSTLTAHWHSEFSTFCNALRVLLYIGAPSARQMLRPLIAEHDIVVLSYDTLRIEADYFCETRFNYCVLDEGHIIKNPKSKIAVAVKGVQARHRLLLSGTPIQNDVVELWSLFDYLMPGFLGTEAQFRQLYCKPILKSRDTKATPKEQENGTLALDRLHRQVLPFVMRRMKEDVLADLPPKIIQDYQCELSPLQVRLYGAFAKSELKVTDSEFGATS